MNILLFSNFSKGSTSLLLKRGFEQGGHRVVAASAYVAPADWLACSARVDISAFIKEHRLTPDVVVMVEASTGTKFFPVGLQDVPAPTVFWAIDNHLNYRWHKEYANLFDVTFFAQKRYVKKGRAYGTRNLYWLPLAADAVYHRGYDSPEKKYDVAFVGKISANRKKFFEGIDKDISLNVLTGVFDEKVGEIYSESKIGINLPVREDLNMRFFEVLASGALLVTQKIDAGTEDLFEEGVHYVEYHSTRDVSVVLKYYLGHDDERREIAEAGRNLCLAKHTYQNRAEEILTVIGKQTDYLQDRRLKAAGYKWYVQQSLVFGHKSFRMKEDARKAFDEALRLNGMGTYWYLFKYGVAYLKQRVEKMFLRVN